MENTKRFLYIAIRASLDAGKKILDIYNDPNADFGVERKADNSPLTLADKASHEIIMNALLNTPFPVLSEEGTSIPYEERAKWNILWIVDPLDGTKEFIKKNGEFTVNIALVEDGKPILGVIYVPVRKELYFSAKDFGSFKLSNVDCYSQSAYDVIIEDAVKLPFASGHQGLVVVASRSHQSEETLMFIENLRKQGQPVTLINSGSSLKICLVAEGTADYYPRFAPTMEWDTAAGDAIARESGCSVLKADGSSSLEYNKEDLLNPWFIVK